MVEQDSKVNTSSLVHPKEATTTNTTIQKKDLNITEQTTFTGEEEKTKLRRVMGQSNE